MLWKAGKRKRKKIKKIGKFKNRPQLGTLIILIALVYFEGQRQLMFAAPVSWDRRANFKSFFIVIVVVSCSMQDLVPIVVQSLSCV